MTTILILLIVLLLLIPTVLLLLIKKEKNEKEKNDETKLSHSSIKMNLMPQDNNIDSYDATVSSPNKYCLCFESDKPVSFEAKNAGIMEGIPCVFLRTGNTVFGRSDSVDVVINENSISRLHFCVEIDNHSAFITDLGSTNGTFVNGIRVLEKQKLNNNDHIQAGRVNLCLCQL